MKPTRPDARDLSLSRLLIVSNRLPVTVKWQPPTDLSAGGASPAPRRLASPPAKKRPFGDAERWGACHWTIKPHKNSGGLWIGWPGPTSDITPRQQVDLETKLGTLNLAPVYLTEDLVERYYEGYANRVLWPLLHHFLGQIPMDIEGWDAYQEANRIFCDEVCRHYQPGDTIWVHDYQLMLLPAMIRERIPDARIGYFLHIPFPSSEIFRALPQREEVLRGLLGADLLGFHSAAYMRHFTSTTLRVLGIGTQLDHINWEHRVVNLGVFPMGIDAPGIAAAAASPDVQQRADDIEASTTEKSCWVLTASITPRASRRLLAFEKLLEDHPELHERVRLMQVAVPSRTNVAAYKTFREQVDRLVGRINGKFATPAGSPFTTSSVDCLSKRSWPCTKPRT